MLLLRFIISPVVFIAIFTVVFLLSQKRENRKSLKERLDELDSGQEGITFEEIELSKSFNERILTPLFLRVGARLKSLTPKGFFDKIDKKLMTSGFSNADPMAFFGMKIALAAVLGGVSFAFSALILRDYSRLMLFVLLFSAMGYSAPDFFVGMISGKRRTQIHDSLPDLLDLLTVSVEAGLGFEQALQQAAAKMAGPVSQEIRRMLQELRLGKKRSDALRSMSDRIMISDFSSFCTAMIQADQLGVSISDVLRVQSDSMRQKRRQRSEEAAMKAPLKMLFPLVFFIFPALFIILLGPAFISIMENFKAG